MQWRAYHHTDAGIFAVNIEPADAVIPIGTQTTSVGKYIAECQRVLDGMASQGINVHGSGYGTNLEGPISVVNQAITKCHEAVHAMGVERIATDIRLGTRTDKSQGQDWAEGLSENQRKRESVKRILAHGTSSD